MNSSSSTLANRFRKHGSGLPASLYRTLILAMADDLDSGGIVAEICRDRLDAPSSAVLQLRLLAGIQRLALQRRAPQLLMYYPNLGGTASPDGAWAVFEPVLRTHADELRQALSIAPQTNEPGRSAALLVGLFDVVSRSGLSAIRLLEVGASAGLNLLVDEYLIEGEGWTSGPPDSPLRLAGAVLGPVRPVAYRILERRGCDLFPVDPSSQDGRLRLTSFVWPHDLHRHERLRAALRIAAEHPVAVDRAPASQWLAQQLDSPCPDGVLTVVWHSITRLYWPLEEIVAVDQVIAAAGERLPIAQVSMESPVSAADSRAVRGRRPAELTVRLAVPGGGDPEPRLLGQVDDHGIPVTMLAG